MGSSLSVVLTPAPREGAILLSPTSTSIASLRTEPSHRPHPGFAAAPSGAGKRHKHQPNRDLQSPGEGDPLPEPGWMRRCWVLLPQDELSPACPGTSDMGPGSTVASCPPLVVAIGPPASPATEGPGRNRRGLSWAGEPVLGRPGLVKSVPAHGRSWKWISVKVPSNQNRSAIP